MLMPREYDEQSKEPIETPAAARIITQRSIRTKRIASMRTSSARIWTKPSSLSSLSAVCSAASTSRTPIRTPRPILTKRSSWRTPGRTRIRSTSI